MPDNARGEQSHPSCDFLILGGGTAGWMAASLLAHEWRDKNLRITLMESSEIGTIGVGEGSTPRMRHFFDRLGVKEQEWMPACNATYKCGIRFPGWSVKPGYQSYYHPFFNHNDNDSVQAFFHNVNLRRSKNVKIDAHPDSFFVSNYLAKNNLAPVAEQNSPYRTDYAYHFDAGLIGEFLKNKALANGVTHIIDTVLAVNRSDSGELTSVETKDNGEVAARFFIDCTGFAGVLIGKTLKVPFKSYTDTMFNDSAVAIPTELGESTLPSQTLSTALNNGWAWKIPLTNRFGNGYVYSSAHCSAESAEQELRAHCAQTDTSVEARHLKMRIGRVERSWENNCLALGLSQGFLEPLEATALMLVQHSIETFMQCYEQGESSDRFKQDFNKNVNLNFDGVHDYIFMHYKMNTRSDTQYWKDNRENRNAPDIAKAVLQCWDKGGDLLEFLKENLDQLVYSPTSWYCILAGMGRFPPQPKKPKPKLAYAHSADVRAHCEQHLQYFQDHKKFIDSMAR